MIGRGSKVGWRVRCEGVGDCSESGDGPDGIWRIGRARWGVEDVLEVVEGSRIGGVWFILAERGWCSRVVVVRIRIQK